MEMMQIASLFNRGGGASDMGFVALFVAAWITVFIVYSMEKSLSFIENAFLYLSMLAIGFHVSWIVAEELKLIEVTKDPFLFAGYMLYRIVAVPLIFVMMINAMFRLKNGAPRLVPAGAALAAILALNGLLLYYDVWFYRRWNFFYDAVLILILQAASYGLAKWYGNIVRREVSGT